MATHIADTMKLIDDAVEGYSKSVFETFGEPVAKMVDAMGIVGVAFIAANALLQWAPIRASDYMKWSIRYILVFAVATSWASFQPIYTIITETPGSIGAALLGATDAPNLNEALDRMITGLFDFSDRAGDQSGLIGISITSVLVWVLGALMACVAIIVTSIGKLAWPCRSLLPLSSFRLCYSRPPTACSKAGRNLRLALP
ncbi:type IV secretion system protein [Ponticoccus litoralis]|uniref:Type IV secretion system protein n=1 Tax=Ponticoccus litoralis TaxID=422297 RepID=A0AAW9SR25_9RHOB